MARVAGGVRGGRCGHTRTITRRALPHHHVLPLLHRGPRGVAHPHEVIPLACRARGVDVTHETVEVGALHQLDAVARAPDDDLLEDSVRRIEAALWGIAALLLTLGAGGAQVLPVLRGLVP